MAAQVLMLPTRADAQADVPDADLVCRGREGDEAALQQLLRRHFAYVQGLVYRLLPSDPESDDLVQEVFVSALDGLDKLNSPDRFKLWLRGIAVNLVHNRLRRRRMLRALGLWRTEQADETVELAKDAPADVVAELRAVYAVIGRLPPERRTALVLRRVEEMTIPEIAEAMRISPATAGRRLAAAESQLEFELRKREPST